MSLSVCIHHHLCFCQVYDPEQDHSKIILRISSLSYINIVGSRTEISLSKNIAEMINLQAFHKVGTEKVEPSEVELNFVELGFRKQFLQRGNMWRFKKDMIGRNIHANGVLSVGKIQASVLLLHRNKKPVMSGIISDQTHIVFRSRSTRLIWLVQISSEMWEVDQVCMSVAFNCFVFVLHLS